MARTAQLALPLVAPAQAQKHVTVNEALARLDAAAQLRVVSPRAGASRGGERGRSYLVPAGAPEASGRASDGRIAVWSNGGWLFLAPRPAGACGTRAGPGIGHIRRERLGPGCSRGLASRGAGRGGRVIEFDHAVAPGDDQPDLRGDPGHAQVIGVTGRVIVALAGPA